MWRIYYFPETGVIKYQINIEAASQMEPMPFIDMQEKVDIKDKMIDIDTLEVIAAPAIKLTPTFAKTEKKSIRELALILSKKP
jgi:hypothetical protein